MNPTISTQKEANQRQNTQVLGKLQIYKSKMKFLTGKINSIVLSIVLLKIQTINNHKSHSDTAESQRKNPLRQD